MALGNEVADKKYILNIMSVTTKTNYLLLEIDLFLSPLCSHRHTLSTKKVCPPNHTNYKYSLCALMCEHTDQLEIRTNKNCAKKKSRGSEHKESHGIIFAKEINGRPKKPHFEINHKSVTKQNSINVPCDLLVCFSQPPGKLSAIFVYIYKSCRSSFYSRCS